MSTTKIEEDGILAFKNFLSGSKILSAKISENDKGPSWDGHILVYNSPEHNDKKDKLKGNIPVQVKSTKGKKEIKESYPIDKSDLINYLNDGGIIFIRPTYNTTIDYTMFIKLLLPVTIKNILKKSKSTTKSITLTLDKIDDVKSFESYCLYFLEHEPKQRNLDNHIDINSLKYNNSEIVSYSIGNGNIDDLIFDDLTFFYHSPVKGVTVPLDIKFQTFSSTRNVEIRIDDKIYFDKISPTKERDGSSYIQLNPVFNINLTNKKILININFLDQSLFKDCLNALNFYVALLKTKEFYIDGKKISFTKISNNKFLKKTRKLYQNAGKIFNFFRLNIDEITVKNLNDNSSLIFNFIDFFINKEEIQVNNTKDLFLDKKFFINRDVLILLLKNSETTYLGYNFIIENPLNSDCTIKLSDKNVVICSRYLVLTVQDIEVIDGYFKEIYNDLEKFYNPEILSNYELFSFNCIKAYDKTQNIEFLLLAEKLMILFRENNDLDSMDYIYYINLMQIYKRSRDLTGDEKKELFEIKENNIENLQLICCVNLLFESYNEFEIVYEKMDEIKQKELKDWPIWNLYKNRESNLLLK